VLGELERLRASEVVRVLDLLVVYKRAGGFVERLEHSDLTSAEGAGAVVGALIGLGAAGDEAADGGHPSAEEFWSLDETIPNDSAAAIALVEHRWAIGVRDAIRTAGGVPVADSWIHPADLVAAGCSRSGPVCLSTTA
jgi:hypothetical protein